MFLDLIERRNPEMVAAAVKLHQEGKLPSNCFVLDLDAVEENARLFKAAADENQLRVFAMTKQIGRNSEFNRAIKRGGIDRAVAVDMACGVACHRSGLKVGHLGHLVQVPKGEAQFAADVLKPDFWTVFSEEKAAEAAGAAHKAGYQQKILARISSDGDEFYRGHEGGFDAKRVLETAELINGLEGATFAGITTFPALLFDHESNSVKPTHNLGTLEKASAVLEKAGYADFEINAPGTTSSVVLPALKQAGATQCEPGNGLHGTTPLHAKLDLPEKPAVCYLTEVSHLYGGEAFVFGGGFYIDPVFPDYDVKCLVSDGGDLKKASVDVPPPSAIDYYAMVNQKEARAKPGDSAVFGFRGQAFVARPRVAGIGGISKGDPVVKCIEDVFGNAISWPYELEK
jgi:predicted amino acid racemase